MPVIYLLEIKDRLDNNRMIRNAYEYYPDAQDREDELKKNGYEVKCITLVASRRIRK